MKRLSMVFGLVCLLSLVGAAQESRGQIIGRVSDPSGAVIVGATIRERIKAQLRGDFINALNHTQFSSLNTSPTSASFGTITGTGQCPEPCNGDGRSCFRSGWHPVNKRRRATAGACYFPVLLLGKTSPISPSFPLKAAVYCFHGSCK